MLAHELLGYVEPDKDVDLAMLGWVVRDMKGRFTGVEVGFLREILFWAAIGKYALASHRTEGAGAPSIG